MSSDLQIEANRRNSQKSTGPRTAAGKAAVTLNLKSLQTGIYAEAEIIHDEDPSQLEALAAAYIGRFQPASAEEHCLVEMLVHAQWTLRRLRRAEAQLWDRNIETSASCHDENTLELGRALNYNESRVFGRVQQRINATQRNYLRALKELQSLQADRPDPQPPAKIEPAVAAHSAPALIGFVSSPVPAPPPDPQLPPVAAQKVPQLSLTTPPRCVIIHSSE